MYDHDNIPILPLKRIRLGDILFPPERHSQATTSRAKRDPPFKKYEGGDVKDIGFVPQWVYRPSSGYVYIVPDTQDTKDIAQNVRETTKKSTEQNKKKHNLIATASSSDVSFVPLRSGTKRTLSSGYERETPTIKRKVSHVPDTLAYKNRKQIENKKFLDDVLTHISPLKRIDTITVMFLDDFENGQQGKKTYTLGSVKGLVSKLGGIHPSRAYIFNPSSAIVRTALARKTHAYPMLVKEGLQNIRLPRFDGVYLDYTSHWKTIKRQGDLSVLFDPSRKLLSDTFVLHMTFSRRGILDINLPQLAETIKNEMRDIATGFVPVFQEIDVFPDDTKRTIKYYSLWKRQQSSQIHTPKQSSQRHTPKKSQKQVQKQTSDYTLGQILNFSFT
jgi:hypothetical protein